MNTATAIGIKQDIGQAISAFVQKKQQFRHCVMTIDVENWQLIDEWASAFTINEDYLLFRSSEEMKFSFISAGDQPEMCILIAPTSWHDFSHTFKALSKNYSGTIVLLDSSFYAYNLANAGVWEMDELGMILEEPLYI